MGDLFFDLSEEIRDLSVTSCVERIASVPEPLIFLRECVFPSCSRHVEGKTSGKVQKYVAQNRPVVITGGANHWPALKRWNLSYLVRAQEEQKLNLTAFFSGDYLMDN
eukprot:8137267-Pyramimonas_sp.AAC.1